MRRGKTRVSIFAIAILLFTAQAHAQDAAAAALYRHGVEHLGAGRWEQAIEALEESFARAPRASVARNLSIAFERNGQFVDALATLHQALHLDHHGDARPWSAAERRAQQLRYRSLEARVGLLQLEVTPASVGVRVPSPARLLFTEHGVHRFVAPVGLQEFEVSASNHESQQSSALLRAGELVRVPIVLTPRSTASAPNNSPIEEGPEEQVNNEAEPTPRELYETGIARLEQNDIPGAIEALEASLRGEPRVSVARNLGLAYERAGRVLDAIEATQRAVELEEQAPTTTRSAELRTLLRARIETLRGQLARVHVRVRPAGAEVRVEGGVRPLASPPGEQRYLLDPGAHTVQVRAAGFLAYRRTIDAAAGAALQLEVGLRSQQDGNAETPHATRPFLDPERAPTHGPSDPSATYGAAPSYAARDVLSSLEQPSAPVTTEQNPLARPLLYTGLGALLLGGGGVLGLALHGNNLADNYTNRCVRVVADASCGRLYTSTQTQLDGYAIGVNLLLGVTAVGTVLSTVGLGLLWPRGPNGNYPNVPAPRWSMHVTPGSVGARITW